MEVYNHLSQIAVRWATMRVERWNTQTANDQPMLVPFRKLGMSPEACCRFRRFCSSFQEPMLGWKSGELACRILFRNTRNTVLCISWFWGWWLAILGDFRNRSPFLIGDYLDIRHPPTFKNFHQSRIQGSHGLKCHVLTTWHPEHVFFRNRFAALRLYACLERGYERLRYLDYESEDWTCFCTLSYFQWSFWFLWKVVGPLLHQVYCLGGNMIPTTFSGARKKTCKTESILLGHKKDRMCLVFKPWL